MWLHHANTTLGMGKCLSRDWLGSLKIELVRSLESELYVSGQSEVCKIRLVMGRGRIYKADLPASLSHEHSAALLASPPGFATMLLRSMRLSRS